MEDRPSEGHIGMSDASKSIVAGLKAWASVLNYTEGRGISARADAKKKVSETSYHTGRAEAYEDVVQLVRMAVAVVQDADVSA